MELMVGEKNECVGRVAVFRLGATARLGEEDVQVARHCVVFFTSPL